LFAEGAVSYLWDNGDTDDSIRIAGAGTYSVAGKNARGCQKEIEINVVEISLPKLNFTFSTNTVNKHHNFVECSVFSDDNVDYLCDMGDGSIYKTANFVHHYNIPDELIQYNISVKSTNEFGCSTEKSAKITVELFVPNVFTPNNDGFNDLFMPGYDLKITDRHGIVLYSGLDGWNGEYKGKPVDQDTYFYVLNYTDAYQENYTKRGYLTLKR